MKSPLAFGAVRDNRPIHMPMPASKRRWFAFSLRTLFVVVTILLLFGVACGIFFGIEFVGEITRDCYAVQWVAQSLIEYMNTHEGTWPKNWEDLGPSYRQLTNQASEEIWSLDELRRRVELDWNTDPQKLLKASQTHDGPPFKAIWLRDGRSVHWEGQEPNQMILEYLQSRVAGEAFSTLQPATHP